VGLRLPSWPTTTSCGNLPCGGTLRHQLTSASSSRRCSAAPSPLTCGRRPLAACCQVALVRSRIYPFLPYHSTVVVTFATGLPEAKKEITRRVDRNALVTGTQLDSTQRGLQNQTRTVLQREVSQLEVARSEDGPDELRRPGDEPVGHAACDRAVKLFWTTYDEHAKRVKKESRCPELKATQKQLQALREREPDTDCWETVSQEWDRATRRLRNSLG
jgi:hypothetical protein